eukprot:CAMPEP_0115846774 /NCGR_PEP_ID=MMETSP0287-20121206/10034_1 /TAXON_ID=412157 /ORGANISM="Chrysochromulina rotalis, Strain UIO044" /LENGTH=232 /DNA_ID=CAMNT_0003300575 /DNA_START=26 /DNA_END=724 /DNA_ORIENTATION=+
MTEVTVNVPDGIYEGDEFTLEYEGTQLTVVCPGGCGPGDAINLQIDLPTTEDSLPQQVNIVIPDGCYAGDEFTVEFDGRSFNIAVPDGCEPGMELTVDVPHVEDTPAPAPAQAPASTRAKYRNMDIPPYRGAGSSSSLEPSKRTAEWAPSTSLFSMGPPEGFGNPAGDFHVGQLVQVTRSDGSWTYGKIMDHEAEGNTYSVMTRAGAKHFVEREDLTDDIVVNPSDGSCAQQ